MLRHRMKQLCQAANLPLVCPHSLRGLNATLALDAGATAHHVAAALGHSSFATTARHYADASTVANSSLRKVAELLTIKGSQPLDLEQLFPKPFPGDVNQQFSDGDFISAFR